MRHLRLRVAVIDDDSSVRKALTRLLKAVNLDVDAFASGREFLESLPSSRPDCIVLDFHMRALFATCAVALTLTACAPAPAPGSHYADVRGIHMHRKTEFAGDRPARGLVAEGPAEALDFDIVDL